MQKYFILSVVMLGYAGFSQAGIERQIKQAIKRSELNVVKNLIASPQSAQLQPQELERLIDVATDSIVGRTQLPQKGYEKYQIVTVLRGMLLAAVTGHILPKIAASYVDDLDETDETNDKSDVDETDDKPDQEQEDFLKSYMKSYMKRYAKDSSSLMNLLPFCIYSVGLIYWEFRKPQKRLADARAIQDLLQNELKRRREVERRREKNASRTGSVLAV